MTTLIFVNWLTPPGDITIETILRAYALGDEGVITILHNAIKYLSIAINNISTMIDTKTTIVHGQLFDETQLIALLKEHSDRHVMILAAERKLSIEIKPYSTTNGALAACGLCVQKNLLTA
ncbi:ROK family protein [Desemzia incerta]|uniref:ROK family protein n=1 Tax=Desemzia incerta TaxID=82801 RepID=UPI00331532C9